MSGKKSQLPPPIFTTTDVYGNYISLGRGTWEGHIVVEHPDMAGLELLVENVIVDPALIRTSSKSNTGVAFISDPGIGPRPEGIRVLVNYSDTYYEMGASSGIVQTAYPIDIFQYGNPQLARIIYERKGKK